MGEKVWGFLCGRGDLILPQLAPVHVPQEAHKVWIARHRRANRQNMSTALREHPNASANVVQTPAPGGKKILKVATKEKVSVLQVRSEIENGELCSWVKVACVSGEGWLKREHLTSVEGFAPLPVGASFSKDLENLSMEVGQDVRHERHDKPDFLSALRETPGARGKQVQGARAEPREHVTILGFETLAEGGESTAWVKVGTASGAGWLKREHLRHDPPAKRHRGGDVWWCRVEQLGGGNASSDDVLKELKELLIADGLLLKSHAIPEQVCSESVVSDTRHWHIKEACVEGSRPAVAALRAAKLVIKVCGTQAQFSDLQTEKPKH